MCQVVEVFNHFSNTRKDLFGFADILAVRKGAIVAIQVTGGGNYSARYNKMRQERREEVLTWLEGGGLVEIHDWRKVKRKRGGKAMVWECRMGNFTLEDIPPDPASVWD